MCRPCCDRGLELTKKDIVMPPPVLACPTLNSHEYGAPTVWTMLPQPGSKGATARYEELIDKLEKNKWVDLRTEALILDMTVYNPRLDFACVIRMVIETPVAGKAASLAYERKGGKLAHLTLLVLCSVCRWHHPLLEVHHCAPVP